MISDSDMKQEPIERSHLLLNHIHHASEGLGPCRHKRSRNGNWGLGFVLVLTGIFVTQMLRG